MQRWGLSADEAIGDGGNREEHRGKERKALSGTESRRDLPVCFRCGKCWLPVDTIRASSGSYINGERIEERRGEQKRKEEKLAFGWERREKESRKMRREETGRKKRMENIVRHSKRSWTCRRVYSCHFLSSALIDHWMWPFKLWHSRQL